jgi:hypothetical protein
MMDKRWKSPSGPAPKIKKTKIQTKPNFLITALDVGYTKRTIPT